MRRRSAASAPIALGVGCSALPSRALARSTPATANPAATFRAPRLVTPWVQSIERHIFGNSHFQAHLGLENALVAKPRSIRWTFDFPASATGASKAITNDLFLGSAGRECAVALATRRTFEAGTHPSRPFAAMIAWAR